MRHLQLGRQEVLGNSPALTNQQKVFHLMITLKLTQLDDKKLVILRLNIFTFQPAISLLEIYLMAEVSPRPEF